MANAAKAVCAWNGIVLHNISAPTISPQGGDVVALKGMSPTNEPYGFETDIKPSYDISFSVPVLVGSQEVRWDQLADANTEGEFTISKASITHVYACMVAHCSEKTTEKRSTVWEVKLIAKTKRAL
jgi:hypothetical protein